MFAQIRAYAQKTANRLMDEPITIRHKREFALDPSNPYGDDVIEFEDETTLAYGWVVSSITPTITQDGAQAVVLQTDIARFPWGTRVDTGDELTIKGETWTAADISSDETYPAMLKVSIQRI